MQVMAQTSAKKIEVIAQTFANNIVTNAVTAC